MELILFGQRTPVFINFTHKIANVFQNYILYQFFSYFALMTLRVLQKLPKIVRYGIQSQKIENKIQFFKAFFPSSKSWNFVKIKFLHFCLLELQF